MLRSSTLLSMSLLGTLACSDAASSGDQSNAPDPIWTIQPDTKSSPNVAAMDAGSRVDAAPVAGSMASQSTTGSSASENKMVGGAAAVGGRASAGTPAAGSGGMAMIMTTPRAGSPAAGSGGMAAPRAGSPAAGTGATAGSLAPAAGHAGTAGLTGSLGAGSGGMGSQDSAAGSGGSGGRDFAAGSGGSDAAAEPTAGRDAQAGASGASPDEAGSGGGGASADPPTAGSGGAASVPPVCSGPPGLYAGTNCDELAPGVEAFQPQYPLFTDDGQGHAAVKSRWVYLPPGSSIDTSNPNRWTFPVGSVFFKQFRDPKTGLRIETRRLEKVVDAPGFASWMTESYAWSSDQLTATLAPEGGVPNALDSGYDIPSTAQCKQCHQLVGTKDVDAPIGFNAIQLNHDLGGLDLATLLMRDQLQNARDSASPNVSLENAVVPGDEAQRPGIGYLHGNCGHCHGGPSPHGHQLLWTPVGTQNVTDLPMFGTGMTGVVCHCLDLWKGHTSSAGAYRYRIDPGSGDTSGIIGRLSANALSNPHDAMPPVGRKGTDSGGIMRVLAFIASLDDSDCAANPPNCSF